MNSNPDKVMFVVNQYYPNFVGGAEISVQTLVEELIARGLSVAVVSLASDGIDSVDVVNGARVYRLSTRNLYSPFAAPHSSAAKLLWHIRDVRNNRMAEEVGRIIEIEKPGWVSTHNLAGFSVAVWDQVVRRGIGLGHVLHDYYLLCPRSTMFKRNRNCETQCRVCKLLSAQKRLASSAVKLVVGISKHVIDRHLELGYFPHARTAVIHNARKYEVAFASAVARAPGAALRIGYIGRLHESKGVELLLRAVARLPPGKWRLCIAGKEVEPGYAARLRRDFGGPDVEFVGYKPADAFYRAVDVLVVPSIWNEPLGMVAVESLGYGVPVIASRAGGLPEILGDNGPGWLFEPGNIDELTGILVSLIQDRELIDSRRSRSVQRRTDFLPHVQADEFLLNIAAVVATQHASPDA